MNKVISALVGGLLGAVVVYGVTPIIGFTIPFMLLFMAIASLIGVGIGVVLTSDDQSESMTTKSTEDMEQIKE